MKRQLLWIFAALLVTFTGCSEDKKDTTTPPVPDTEQADVKSSPDVPSAEDAEDAADPPDTAVEPQEPTGRKARRMSIEQLARSIPVITGGIKWIENFGDGDMDMLQILSGTLGAPDYLLVTEENLEPSLIIAKFMQDASHRICPKWLSQDALQPKDKRTFVRHDNWQSLEETDIKFTLRALQFRFFARYVDAGDDKPINNLYKLFVTASSGAPAATKARDGWMAVCLALMTEPEFVLY